MKLDSTLNADPEKLQRFLDQLPYHPVLELMGEGSSAKVVEAPAAYAQQTILPALKNVRWYSALPTKPGATVVIKYAHNRLNPKEPWRTFVLNNQREMAIQADVATRSALDNGQQITPTVYFTGTDLQHGIFVTCMELIEGDTLYTYFEENPTHVPLIFRKLENAIVRLWKLGYTHNDMHYSNIMIDSRQRIFILDFERAVRIPAKLRESVLRLLEGRTDDPKRVDKAWFQYLGPHVDRVLRSRGYKVIVPNGKVLRHLHGRL
jgi:serine/threonine protein kinase